MYIYTHIIYIYMYTYQCICIYTLHNTYIYTYVHIYLHQQPARVGGYRQMRRGISTMVPHSASFVTADTLSLPENIDDQMRA